MHGRAERQSWLQHFSEVVHVGDFYKEWDCPVAVVCGLLQPIVGLVTRAQALYAYVPQAADEIFITPGVQLKILADRSIRADRLAIEAARNTLIP